MWPTFVLPFLLPYIVETVRIAFATFAGTGRRFVVGHNNDIVLQFSLHCGTGLFLPFYGEPRLRRDRVFVGTERIRIEIRESACS